MTEVKPEELYQAILEHPLIQSILLQGLQIRIHGLESAGVRLSACSPTPNTAKMYRIYYLYTLRSGQLSLVCSNDTLDTSCNCELLQLYTSKDTLELIHKYLYESI